MDSDQNQIIQHDRASVFDRVIALALRHRAMVLAACLLLAGAGGMIVPNLKVDVFPDLNRPVVTVLVEAHGLAPEEVEVFATIPLESALLGAPDVERVRSASKRGVAILQVEFPWGTDIYRCRQIVSERLNGASGELPADVRPLIGPISSIMGEIQLIGLTSAPPGGASSAPDSLRELRTFADWTVRKRLLAIPGVSNVTVLGGEAQEFQILIDGERLSNQNLNLLNVTAALQGLGQNTGGGFLERDGREYALRNMGSIYELSEIESAVVGYRAGVPVRVRDIGQVKIGFRERRGDAGIDGVPGVIVAVQKQPGVSTMLLTARIESRLRELQAAHPGFQIHGDLFRQADFIRRAIENVYEAMRDGSLIILLILFLFLWNLRTTIITLLALPLSLIAGVLILAALGFEINTMTLGGLTIAIGELVDDAIVDMENIFRRLRENRLLPHPRPALQVVYEASSEVRNSIVLATAVVILVFAPLLLLGGVEGQLFRPLAAAYIASLFASLAVALTLTPVICYYLLPAMRFRERESWLVRRLKSWQARTLEVLLRFPRALALSFAALLLTAAALVPLLRRDFLPSFNEGTLTIEFLTPTGTGLARSVARAQELETLLRATPGVTRISRRTGRAEMDEHAEGVHYSEFDVTIDPSSVDRTRADLLRELREKFQALEGVAVNIGQPISHRLDHLLSGIRAEVAIMIYGEDFDALQYAAYQTREILKDVPGVADLLVETAALAPEWKIAIDHEAAARYGLAVPEITRLLEVALAGERIGRVPSGQRIFAIRVRLDPHSRRREALPGLLLKHLPDGTPVRLGMVADIYESQGPYEIKRENGSRRIAVQLNTADRDLFAVVADIRARLDAELRLPGGFHYEIGGRYRSAREATRLMLLLALCSLGLIVALLYRNFRSWSLTAQVLLNLPFAFIGGVFALYLAGVALSMATMVGFVALAGIASRNGIMMLSHFGHLLERERESFSEAMVIRGAQERLVPVLMTAATAIFALLPILLSGSDAPGKEILYPVALVISGGLFSSTLLDVVLTPVVYYRLTGRSRPFRTGVSA